jgi:hypothetical protein
MDIADLALQADRQPSVAHFAALAKAQEQSGRQQEAAHSLLIATLLQMAVLNPHDSATWLQIGAACSQAAHDQAASRAFRAAIVTQPHYAEAINNLAVCLSGAAAVALQGRAVRLAPGRADFHTNLGHALLSAGDFTDGFREWEWRPASPPRDFSEPRWRGEAFPGRTLLVHAEQGYGDNIQFCRYLPLAAKMGGRIIVETRQPLAGLLGRLPGIDAIHIWGTPLPPFDLHIPLPSLAAYFPTPPTTTPYLSADPVKSAFWRAQLEEAGARPDRLKVGLVWSGNLRGHDRRRAVPFDLVEQLAASVPQVQFFGVQRDPPPTGAFRQLGLMIDDFDDLATLLSHLDLLISVDTASAHLAGALNRDVWVLLHSNADWRWWGEQPERSAWYPSAKLYRQSRAGNWNDVMERIRSDLFVAMRSF